MKLSTSLSVVTVATALGLFSTSAQALNVRAQATRSEASATRVRMDVDVATSSALDILFVIDDSGSMAAHQQNLLANVGELVRAAKDSGVDLHAGVITTSADGLVVSSALGARGVLAGARKKFAASSEGDFEKTLTENLKLVMTPNGSGTEQPFEAAQFALSEPLISTLNQGFLRPKAALAIFVLTDSDDQSPLAPEHYVQLVKNLKAKTSVSVHAAYIPADSTTCDRMGEPKATRIEAVLNAFGTKDESVNLCDPSFGSKLSKIGDAYSVVGVRTVQLNLAPQISSLTATFGTQKLEAGDLLGGWVYDSSKMQLQLGEKIDWTSQPAGTRLLIDYLAK